MPDVADHASLADAASGLPDAARATLALPRKERPSAWARLLRNDVHDVAMHASAVAVPADLERLAAAVREHVPDGAETKLPPRVAVFVRLLRHGALEAAWTLANDNASGVVRPAGVPATWAGGSHLNTPLALPTVVEGSEVYAWLPGFRDPRWSVPDDVYSMTSRVVLRSELLLAVFCDGALELSGAGYLGLLHAAADDVVGIQLAGPGGARVHVDAERRRYPGLVKPRGPDLTRLAWGGWSARVELDALAGRSGGWAVRLSVEQQGLRRDGALSARPAGGVTPLVDDAPDGDGDGDSDGGSDRRYLLKARGSAAELVLHVGPGAGLRRLIGAVRSR